MVNLQYWKSIQFLKRTIVSNDKKKHQNARLSSQLHESLKNFTNHGNPQADSNNNEIEETQTMGFRSPYMCKAFEKGSQITLKSLEYKLKTSL